MKKPLIISTVVAAVALAAMAKESAPSVSATAALKDGSTVKGEFLTGKISGTAFFKKDLALDTAGPFPFRKLARLASLRTGLGQGGNRRLAWVPQGCIACRW